MREDLKSFSVKFVVLLLLFRIGLAAFIGLSDDEAYYWDWTRQLDWSYYDHPALTTWLIYLSQSLFGVSEFSVRLPAMLCATGSYLLVYKLSKDLFGIEAARKSILLFALAPIFGFGSVMVFPDIPLLFLWLLFMSQAWKLVEHPDSFGTFDWLGLGVVFGLAMLSKYPAVFMAGSLGLCLLFMPTLRPQFKNPALWAGLVVAALVASPIVLWNMKYDWPSFQYHLSGRHKGGHLSFTRYGQFLGSQAGALTPFLFVVVFTALVTAFKNRVSKNWLFVFCFALPPLAVFYWQPLYSNFKPHWPAPAYLPLIMASGYLFLHAKGGWRKVWPVTIGFLLAFNVIFYTALLYPVMPKVYSLFGEQKPWEARFDITNDFYGWDLAGRKALEYLAKIEGQGVKDPFLATHRYQLTGQLGFSSGISVWNIGKRTEQYDFWQTPEAFQTIAGKDAIVVADNRYYKEPLKTMKFDACEALPSQKVFRSGVLAREFFYWHCKGFKGKK